MRRWDGLVNTYIGQCVARGLMASTLVVRQRELERWGLWLKRRKPQPRLEDVGSDLIIRYVRGRTAFHARATVCSTVSQMRLFGEHLVQEGIWLKNPLRWIRGPKLDPRMRLPRRIGAAHLRQLWDTVATRPEGGRRALLHCLLAILYATGARRGELVRLNVSDWDRDSGVLRLDGQKTGQPRKLPLGPGVARCLEAWLPYRQVRLEASSRLEEPALFVTRRGLRMRDDDLSTQVHLAARRAQVPLVSLHQFRHTCASDLLESGVQLPEIRQLLGHATIVTTMRYLQIADSARAEAMRRHPINEMLAAAPAAEPRRNA